MVKIYKFNHLELHFLNARGWHRILKLHDSILKVYKFHEFKFKFKLKKKNNNYLDPNMRDFQVLEFEILAFFYQKFRNSYQK